MAHRVGLQAAGVPDRPVEHDDGVLSQAAESGNLLSAGNASQEWVAKPHHSWRKTARTIGENSVSTHCLSNRMLIRLFRLFGTLGIVLLGAALAIAPVAAFEDRMIVVSALGIAGIALLLAAWLLRKWDAFLHPPPADPGAER